MAGWWRHFLSGSLEIPPPIAVMVTLGHMQQFLPGQCRAGIGLPVVQQVGAANGHHALGEYLQRWATRNAVFAEKNNDITFCRIIVWVLIPGDNLELGVGVIRLKRPVR